VPAEPDTSEARCPRCGGLRGEYHVFLPPTLYDEAKRHGYDMTCYVRQEPIPVRPQPLRNTAHAR
jgi:hypothetical protein